MEPVTPLPLHGDVFADARGGGRVMRLSWHDEDEVLVLSLWRGDTCAGTFRLTRDQAAHLIAALADGLAQTTAMTSRLRAG